MSRALLRLGIALAAATLLTPFGFSQQVLYERQGPGLIDRTIVVPRAQFSKALALRLSQDFVRAHRSKKLARLLIVTERHDGASYQFGKGQFHTTYYQWLDHFADQLSQIGPQAEVLKLGSSAAVRIRSAEGNIEEVALGGGDVFRLLAAGMKLELLHLSIGPSSILGQLQVNFFLQAERGVSAQEALRITRKIRASVGFPRISVSIRPDGWFIGSGTSYPWVHPFDRNTKPPSWEKYSGSVEVFCGTAPKLVCDDKAGLTVAKGMPSTKGQIPLPR